MHGNQTHDLKVVKESKGERENKKERKVRCGNRTHDLLSRFKEENKRKIKGEACGNRTHYLLGILGRRIKETNGGGMWESNPRPLRHI